MNCKSKILVIGLMLLSGLCLGQQRPTFSTYVYNGLAINPAYAGSQNLFSAIFTNRNQWINIDGAPNFQSLTAQTTWKDNQIGTGLNITRDAIGVHQQFGVYASYAYKIKMNRNILAMGLQGGFDNRKSDFNQIRLFDPDDPYLSGQVTTFDPNFGVGLYLANPHWFLGFSIPYILQPKIRDASELSVEGKQNRYYYLNAGFVTDLSKNVKISPSTLIRKQQSGVLTFDVNVNFIFDEIIYAGFSYRWQDSFVLMTQMVLNENFRLGYAYDIPTSALGPFTSGTHELFINYRIKIKGANKDPLCPVYF